MVLHKAIGQCPIVFCWLYQNLIGGRQMTQDVLDIVSSYQHFESRTLCVKVHALNLVSKSIVLLRKALGRPGLDTRELCMWCTPPEWTLCLVAAMAFLRKLVGALEVAMKMSSMGGAGAAAGGPDGQAAAGGSAKAWKRQWMVLTVPFLQIVHNVQLVRARPLYGFYHEEQVFVKLVL
eukprot:scaffold158820_cov19-Tisochrysis_lutea.AAC.2